MRKKILHLLIFLTTANIVCDMCYAAPVDVNSAKAVANNFYSSNSNKWITGITLAFTETAGDGSPAYYVFNINTNDGFVIVTADDAAMPIIGYATTGRYDVNTLVPALAAWLKTRLLQISYIKSYHLLATQKIKERWQTYQTAPGNNNSRSTENAVGPLCATTWNQTQYYNALCPGGSPTGCTATAMAQIMKYWSYPLHGTGSVTYIDSTTLGFTENYGVQSADFANTTYDWSVMPNNLTSFNGAVDTLMYQCGVSVYMDYNPYEGSNSNVVPYDSLAWSDPYGGSICAQTAFSQYFGYDSAAMQGLQRNDYTDEAWDSILENELNNNRPIQYAGYTDDTKLEGHTWVCDGYNPNNEFHMNWGWGGDYDGYFSLDALNADIYHLNSEEEALIGIQPAQSVATGIKEVSFENSVSLYPNPTNGKATIYSSQVTIGEIEVYDALGNKVFELMGEPLNKSTIDFSSLPAGLYLIVLQDGAGSTSIKLVKE